MEEKVSSMGNRASTWFFIILMIIGVVTAVGLGIYAYNVGGISDTNIVNTERLADIENEENNENLVVLNEVVTTSSAEQKISPNAIVIEKKYYKTCDHLIREIVDIPTQLVNQTEEEVKSYYSGWKVEKFSTTEIVVYKEFQGICNEHYVIKDHNGVLGIYTESDENVLEWQEDTEIGIQYLPEEDIEKFKAGVEVVGKINLYNFLEDYE